MNSPRLAFSLALCALVWSSHTSADSKRVLVVVGSEHGLAGEWPLTYAVRDAENFARVMVDLGDVSSDHVIALRDPTPRDVLGALRSADKLMEAGSTLLVFYSGHGSESALHLRNERLELSTLHAELRRVRAGLRLLVVDACRGGVARKGFKKARTFDIQLTQPSQYKGLVVLSAAGDGENALESYELKSGVFSHHLISALRGAGDRDADGRISLYEAYEYAYSSTLKTSSHASDNLQHPTLSVAVEGSGPLVLTRVAPARSLLMLPAAPYEQYLVFERGSDSVLAEAWTAPDRRAYVALPAGHFIVYRKDAQGHAATEVTLPFGGTRYLQRSDFVRADASESASKGGSYAMRQNALSIGIGATLVQGTYLGPAARFAYMRRTGAWVPAVALGLLSQTFETTTQQAARQLVELAPGVEYRANLGILTAGIGAGMTVGWMWQQLRARSGLRARDLDSALTFGVYGRGRLTLPLNPAIAWQIDAQVTGRFYREDRGRSSTGVRLTQEIGLDLVSGAVVSF